MYFWVLDRIKTNKTYENNLKRVFKIKNQMKYFLFFTLFSLEIFAQSDKMAALLKERSELYANWKEALDQKSGIFGNQSKADLQEVSEVLKKIIRKDNEILDELEASQTHDYQQLQEKYNDLLQVSQKLETSKNNFEKKLNEQREYQKTNYSQIERAEGDKILMGLLAFVALILLIIMYTKMASLRRKVKALESIIKSAAR